MRSRIHSLLHKHGVRVPYPTTFSKKGVAWLREQRLGFMDDAILHSDLTLLGAVEEQVQFIEEKIAALAVDDPQVKLLMTMTGIGHYGALLITSEIGDVSRFRSAGKLVLWAGLCPTLHQSGESTRYGRIKKEGNRHVRWMMVQAAQTASRHDPAMRGLYERTARRHGKQNAVIRVANKMTKIAWHILTRREPYRHRKEELYRTKLKRMERLAVSGLA